MDSLKALIEKKRKAAEEEFGGKKYVKRANIEVTRLQKLREEEQRELEEKDRKRKQALENESASVKAKEGKAQKVEEPPKPEEILAPAEVIRRLRLLGHPATLFGEDDLHRLQRLRRAEEEMQLEDEHAGGQQSNSLLELQRGAKKDKSSSTTAATKVKPTEEEQLDPTMEAFKRAAEVVKAQQEESKMTVEEKLMKYVRRWCDEWGQDLQARPEEVKKSAAGNHATMLYKQTMTYLDPMLKQLKKSGLPTELKTGLWLMVEAMRDRNYLYAYDIYMKVAIGNAPWPIGVTSVGIHERSAREKISHVMNSLGTAHVMNDEATRKYLQGLKRLMTFVQRAYPTDPSRSVDFDAFHDPGRGVIGNGSDKQALLAAEARGATAQTLSLPPPPTVVHEDGSIKIPPKWNNIIGGALRQSGKATRKET